MLDKEEEEEENVASKNLIKIKEIMNETVESNNEERLVPTTTTTTEKPKRDPEAIARYEADYPDLVKDPVLARIIATATSNYELQMRRSLDDAMKCATSGDEHGATTFMESAVSWDYFIQEQTQLIKDVYNKSRQILDGKRPTSTE